MNTDSRKASTKILAICGLTKRFGGITAADQLSFDIDAGSVTALIGPNGAGKTTVFNLVTGFLKPDCGEIVFNGISIVRWAPNKIAELGISRTFQALRLFPQMTVLANVMLATKCPRGGGLWAAILRSRDVLREEERNRDIAMECLQLVGLEQQENRLAEELSHGQRKLLALARALATDADLLLLDEPTAALFPEVTARILELIRELSEHGKTILFIAHDMKVVMGISKKIIVINQGNKIAEGLPGDIQRDEGVLEAYLGKRWKHAP